ncbi:MAG: bi-domain-containing oxidoreductase, partial [Planctomycetota bacterium]
YGLGLIGLVTVQLLRASGCNVIGVDINQARLELAESFGAATIHGAECGDVPAKIRSMTSNHGADAVLITASAKTDAIISDSAKMCRQRGRVVLVGVIGLNLNRSDFYEKEIRFQVSCSYGPGRYDSSYEELGRDYPYGFVRWTEQRNFEAILQMLATNRLDFSPLITHHFQIAEAASAYSTIQTDPSALGVILDYEPSAVRKSTVESNSDSQSTSDIVGAVIGAGNFTRATLMPAIAKLPLQTKYIVGRSNGATVQHVASRFSASLATTDFEQVLGDPEVNLGFVTTNHDSHARIACQLLESGKHAFIEKPLALSTDALLEVVETSQKHPALHLMVGFNRRFSPHMAKAKELLRGRAEPISLNLTMNAGAIPADHWVHDPQKGGGRIIGEACHFIDLATFLTGSRVRSVSAHRFGENAVLRDDKMAMSLEFEDGSIASINYFANGSKNYPKESIEVFSDERVLKVDNFRTTRGYGFAGFKKLHTKRQEKGHKQQFQTFVDSIRSGSPPLIPISELVNVTLASFAAVTSARERRTIELASEYGSFC